ncbi:MAG: succinylglutamate desuccinylase/aspartoacylase family protein [Tannerellaceae bacterium]|jgi:hypothetical protein|nr:succinylglutamate desuccinylase/aspartoacylase family protein [Tannerellaceae bacterium]
MKKLLLLLIISLFHTGLYAFPEMPVGEGMFTYKEYLPFADRPVDVHYYIPESGDIRNMPIIFVFEGADRNYGYLLKAWKEEAKKHQFMVFIPQFDLERFPLSDYQEIGVMDKKNNGIRPVEEQTPALTDKMFEYIRQCSGSKRKGYMIYGHSAGGQFVQRFMLFHDSPYVDKAVISAPGWYTFPDTTQDYPYGVRNIPYITPEAIKKYLAKPIILQLATGDTIRESYLRKTPQAEMQGRNRYERGNKFYQYLRQIAAEHNWPCNWQKIEEEGLGHQSVEMGQRAVPVMLGDSLRALFIGNSYTHYNQLVYQVQSLAVSIGHKLSVKSVEYGGWTLKQHVANPETRKAIQEGNWDFVILQEHSQAPAGEKEWVKKNVYNAAYSLDSLRRLYNPKGKTVFYMTWGHDIESYSVMQQRLAENYLEMTKQLDAWCAPVGIAWKRVRMENPDITLYDPDRSHPSLQGSYLAANVFCSVFFGRSYTSTYYADLPQEEALYLQRTAQETVLGNLTLWNIRPFTQPEAVTRSFYPEPEKNYSTPTLRKPVEEGLASLFEITQYLKALTNKYPEKVTLSNIGNTPQGREIPILYFGHADAGKKMKIWIQAGLHGNEPAGTEAACILSDYLLHTPTGNALLEKNAIALIPIANVDGYALQNRKSSCHYDLNRDQSKLADPVTCMLKEAYRKWNPQIALDIHEFNPVRKEFEYFRHSEAATADDVLFLSAGHPNISTPVGQLSNGLFREEAKKALTTGGYSSGFYFTPTIENDSVYAVKDAKSPQSSATFQALTNTVSLFIEIRGIGLGRMSFARRAECGFLVARSLLETAAHYDKEIKNTLQRAIEETCAGKNDVCVTFQSTRKEFPISFIDFGKNERFTQILPTLDALQAKPEIIRKRPKAYVMPDTCKQVVEKLRILGVEVEQLEYPNTLTVQAYRITKYQQSTQEWENICPVNVSTQLIEKKRKFPAGSYLVRLNQKNANLAITLLEPESANGFVNFEVISTAIGEELPIYRLMDSNSSI